MKLGTCCSSTFVTDDQAGYILCVLLLLLKCVFFPFSLLSERPCNPARFKLAS